MKKTSVVPRTDSGINTEIPATHPLEVIDVDMAGPIAFAGIVRAHAQHLPEGLRSPATIPDEHLRPLDQTSPAVIEAQNIIDDALMWAGSPTGIKGGK